MSYTRRLFNDRPLFDYGPIYPNLFYVTKGEKLNFPPKKKQQQNKYFLEIYTNFEPCVKLSLFSLSMIISNSSSLRAISLITTIITRNNVLKNHVQ